MSIHEPSQPFALRGTSFTSWGEYDRAVRDRLSKLAAAEMAAAAFSHSALMRQVDSEFLPNFPNPHCSLKRNQRTGTTFVLGRNNGKRTFCKPERSKRRPIGGEHE